MRKFAPILVAFGLLGCSDLEDFEGDLMGVQASAWELCKKEFGDWLSTPPIYGEETEDRILFAWNEENARDEGGPIMCATNGTGTELTEVRIAGVPFG